MPLKYDPTVKNIYKFTKAIAELVNKLPRVSLTEDSNEMELCSPLVDSFLSGLFDDLDQDIFLQWTNETTLEAKTEQNSLNCRSDLCTTRLQGVEWSLSLSFREVKPACQGLWLQKFLKSTKTLSLDMNECSCRFENEFFCY